MKKLALLIIFSFQLSLAMEADIKRIEDKLAHFKSVATSVEQINAECDGIVETHKKPLQDLIVLNEQNDHLLREINALLSRPNYSYESFSDAILRKTGAVFIGGYALIAILIGLAHLQDKFSKNGTNLSLAEKAQITFFVRFLRAHGYTVTLDNKKELS